MSDDLGTSPQSVAGGAVVETVRAHMLGEAVGLVVDQICGPLQDAAFASRLLGSVVSNEKECAEMLSNTAEDCRSSFQVELTHLVESENVIGQLAKLETIIDEWEPKKKALMEAEPSDVQWDAGPDPYAAELQKQMQRLSMLEQTVEEYKAKIVAQRDTIGAVLKTIHEKRDEVDARLERTQAKVALVANSSVKKWSDSEIAK